MVAREPSGLRSISGCQLALTTFGRRRALRYALTALAGASTPVEVPKSQYDATVEAKSSLLECLFIEEKFDLLIENYLELEKTLLECALGYLAAPLLDNRRADTDRALFNRRLLNLLSSARTYADQVREQHIPGILSKADAVAVKAAFSKEYDDRLGYRAMDALRNHALHFDAPVHLVNYPSRRVERESGAVLAFTVNPCLRTEDLRRNPKFKRAVLRELEARSQPVDLKPLVRQYVEGLWVVHAQVRELTSPHILEWEATLDLAKSTFLSGGNDVRSAFLLAASTLREDGTFETSVSLSDKFNEYRRFLEAKNGRLDSLSLRYVTSETDDAKP
jgi:hypothetical protein